MNDLIKLNRTEKIKQKIKNAKKEEMNNIYRQRKIENKLLLEKRKSEIDIDQYAKMCNAYLEHIDEMGQYEEE